MSGGAGEKSDGAVRGDDLLREAFAELRRGEAALAPPLERLLAPAPRRRGRAGRTGSRGAPWAGLRPAVRTWAGAAALFLAAGLGLWLGDAGSGRRPVVGREEPALSSWVAPTNFLLDTPGIELLRSTPEIPGPLPSTLTASTTDLATGDYR